MKSILRSVVLFLCLVSACSGQNMQSYRLSTDGEIRTGAERMDQYLSLIRGKRLAIVANPTSRVGKMHLLDTLMALGMNIRKVFAPEHGFRGEAEAGEHIDDEKDIRTGVTVISLYGKNKKPTSEQLKDVDMVIFDIQDVGARFYTYISTLHYIMETCAEVKLPLLVLDRPNPNGFYVDGPVMEKSLSSFVGLDPVPVVHGMTVAEYALMLNGEHWLSDSLSCELFYVKNTGWDHSVSYEVPVPTSPNLPNMSAIYLYPSLCLFEGTAVSIGRGTPYPFQVIGYPGCPKGKYSFNPVSIPGKAIHPQYENMTCTGFDLHDAGKYYMSGLGLLNLDWIVMMYQAYEPKEKFFNDFFDKLAGTSSLRLQIISGTSVENIRNSWQPALDQFKITRRKYLLYPDFEK